MCRKGGQAKGRLPDFEIRGEHAFEILVWGGTHGRALGAEIIVTFRTLGSHYSTEALRKSARVVVQGTSLFR